jgi:hypothetical protein
LIFLTRRTTVKTNGRPRAVAPTGTRQQFSARQNFRATDEPRDEKPRHKKYFEKTTRPAKYFLQKKQGENFCKNNGRAAPDISPRKTAPPEHDVSS